MGKKLAKVRHLLRFVEIAKDTESTVSPSTPLKQEEFPSEDEHMNLSINIEDITDPSDSSITKPVRQPQLSAPICIVSPPNNFDTALGNIKTAGLEPLSDRDQQALKVLLHDFPWKASSPHRYKESRFSDFQARWSTLPGLYPVLDAFGWPELTPPDADWVLVIDAIVGYMWILFGRTDGYYFYFGEFEVMYFVGNSLETFLKDLDDFRQYKTLEEGGWEEIPEYKIAQ
jgi:hypothetical protein